MYTTRAEVIGLLKNKKITDEHDLRKLKIPTKSAGSGAFRHTLIVFPKDIYERFVIKFPFNSLYDIEHAQNEIRAIRYINKTKKLWFLRPFLPEVFYSNYRSGIIAMEYYKKCKSKTATIAAYTLQMAYAGLYPEREVDIEYYNIRETNTGEYKLIDLGLFEH